MSEPCSPSSLRLPTVIVLAAGRGERFTASGGRVHKLQALLGGKPVLDHVLEAVRASGLAWHVVEANPARPGMGDSIAAGVEATADAAGWLILPGDLPLVQAATLLAVATAPEAAVTVPVFAGERGHPVRFSAACGGALRALRGPAGAAAVVRAQAQAGSEVLLLAVDDPGILADIDTLDDLRRAEAALASRADCG